ncbi:hypothetical protein [Bradyrhizobium embrapense]
MEAARVDAKGFAQIIGEAALACWKARAAHPEMLIQNRFKISIQARLLQDAHGFALWQPGPEDRLIEIGS